MMKDKKKLSRMSKIRQLLLTKERQDQQPHNRLEKNEVF